MGSRLAFNASAIVTIGLTALLIGAAPAGMFPMDPPPPAPTGAPAPVNPGVHLPAKPTTEQGPAIGPAGPKGGQGQTH